VLVCGLDLDIIESMVADTSNNNHGLDSLFYALYNKKYIAPKKRIITMPSIMNTIFVNVVSIYIKIFAFSLSLDVLMFVLIKKGKIMKSASMIRSVSKSKKALRSLVRIGLLSYLGLSKTEQKAAEGEH
jgi:hypothetical protein